MALTTHDHEVKIGSTTMQLDIARDTNGNLQYQVLEDIPTYQRDLEVAQSDWTGGHGQYGFVDPKMYFEGQSIDTTNEGRVILGALVNEVYGEGTEKVHYDTGDDSASYVYGANAVGQTFTAADNHTLGYAKILAYRVGNPGLVTMTIRDTVGGLPVATALATGTYNGNLLGTSTAGAWITFDFGSGVPLLNGSVYAICITVADGDASNYVGVRRDATSGAYTGGAWCVSTDTGATWSL